jgi:XTP/dITP diphosphohydrolase
MNIVLATRNQTKIDQIRPIFHGLDITLLSLKEAGVEGGAVTDGITIQENAVKKALYVSERLHEWVIADDTALCIDALEGRPGIYSSSWAGEGKTDEQIMSYTLDQLAEVPLMDRTAKFSTAAAIVSPGGDTAHCFTKSIKGSILLAPRVACQPNMPYSAIFVPKGQEKTWAEMTVEEENGFSQRGAAFWEVRKVFFRLLKNGR